MIKKLFKPRLKHWAAFILLLTTSQAYAQTITIGAGTSNTNGTGGDPVDDYYNGMHYQTVYTATELSTAGLTAGSSLTAIGFEVTQAPGTLANYKVSLAHTTQADAATYISPSAVTFTPVIAPFSYTPTVQSTGNFDMINFTTNFMWDGSSNIVVDICTGPANPYVSPYGGVAVFTATNGAAFARSDGAGANTICTAPTGAAATGTDSYGILTSKPNVRFNYIAGTSCAGKPNAGVAAASAPVSAGAVCPGATFTLSTTGSTSASGLTYDWQYNDGSGWLPTGGTNVSHTVTGGITVATSYRLVIACGSNYDTSNVVAITINPFYNCYCTPISGCTNEGIQNVTFGSINNNSNKCTNTSGYENFGSLGSLTTVTQGQQVSISVTAWINSNPAGAGVWIDYDHNGVFDASEFTLIGTTTSFAGTAGAFTFTNSVVIDINALTGITRMRVRSANSTTATQISSSTACLTSNAYGEYEDYLITINPATGCTGTPNHVTASAPASVCPSIPFNLTTSNASTGVGLSYEWQYNDGSGWQTLLDASSAPVTTLNYTMPGITIPTQFRFISACATGGRDTSNVTSTTINGFMTCYCTPSGGASTTYGINSFSTSGGWTNINNMNTGPSAGGYTDYSSSMTLTTSLNSVITISGQGMGTGTYGWAVWVDWDHSGVFDATEKMYNTTSYTNTIPASTTFTVPAGALSGTTKMRVIANYNNSNPSGEMCSTTTGTAEWEDYMVNIVALPSCIPPSALSAANVTANGADLVWTENNSAALWKVEYGPAPLTAATTTVVYTATNPHIIGSGLTPATNYQFNVRSICGVGDTSLASSGYFTTLCATFPAPFLESFNSTNTPNCWTNSAAVPYGWMFGTGYSSPGYDVAAATDHTGTTGSTYAWVDNSYVYNTSTPTTASLTSPNINIATLTNPQVRYYMISHNPSWIANGNNKLVVEAYDNTLSTWVTLDSVQQSFATAGWQERSASLSGVTSSITQLRFRFGGTATSCCYNDILIDDIHVENIPTCLAPTGVTASNTTPSSIDIGWTSNTTATLFQIEYAQTTGAFTLGTGTRVGPTSVTNPETISGLTANKPYSFYVREICGPGDTSAWSSRVTAYTFPAIPTNDDCGTPVDISNGALYYGTNAGAGQTLAACDATPTATDVWYTFTTGATAGVLTDSVNTSFSGGDVVVQMFSGPCTSLTPMVPTAGTTYNATTGCVDGPAAGMEWSNYTVAANTTYFIRVYAYNTTPPGPFSIQITGAPLAIRLDKISASNAGASNRIDWNTLSEESTDKFELERSIDGKNFSRIHERKANGAASRYTYLDNSAAKGMNYYRLRMTAANGGATYSETVSAFVKSSGFEVEAFPNPVSHDLTVKVSGVQGADATVQVTDVTGKVIRTVKMNATVETIDMSGLANGIYLIKYADADHTQTIKVNKQ